MEISTKLVEEIVNDATGWSVNDPQVSSSVNVVLALSRVGGKVVCNSEQVGGTWVTKVKFGMVTFIAVSARRFTS